VFDVSTGFTVAGGTNSGDMRLTACAISVTASPATPTELVIVAAANALVTDNLANVTLWVQGGISGLAQLTLPNGGQNHGVIKLQSVIANWESKLTVGTGSFTNGSGGSIHALLGSGGARNFTGMLTNFGSILGRAALP
jgi:hypothetical protein